MLPVWTFALADALLERRVWMAPGENTTYISYHLTRGTAPLELDITPLVTHRDFHTLTSGDGWRPEIDVIAHGALVQAFAGATPFRLLSHIAAFRPGGDWYWNFRHRQESARGLRDHGDLYAAGAFAAHLDPSDMMTLVLTTEDQPDLDGRRSLALAQERQQTLLRHANAESSDPVVHQLVLAADQFIVERRPALTPHSPSRTIIAGYHWFNDWGRDTMIALPGLTLATGRAADAAAILRTFAQYLSDGLLPNNFPDRSGAVPGYNTADATLWYVLAVRAYHDATGDRELTADLLPALRGIVEHHIAGTRHGIGVDPADDLLRAGEPGVQLTWMDAKVGDWVVTPRIGKPVEINALWYNTLRTVADLLAAQDEAAAGRYAALAARARDAFQARFVRPEYDHLADVVDGPDGDDWSLRPNQIFALSLPYPLLEGDRAKRVLDAAGRALLTSHGLRTLSPDDPAYVGRYAGDVRQRDGGYHQGTVWAWLLGPFAEAHFRAHGDRAAALALLRPLAHHLTDAGLGTISEIFDADPPHAPRGAIAQAWSVAEALRVLRILHERR